MCSSDLPRPLPPQTQESRPPAPPPSDPGSKPPAPPPSGPRNPVRVPHLLLGSILIDAFFLHSQEGTRRSTEGASDPPVPAIMVSPAPTLPHHYSPGLSCHPGLCPVLSHPIASSNGTGKYPGLGKWKGNSKGLVPVPIRAVCIHGVSSGDMLHSLCLGSLFCKWVPVSESQQLLQNEGNHVLGLLNII